MADKANKAEKSGMVPIAAVFAVVSMISVGMGWYIGSEIRKITETQLAEASASPEALAARSAGGDLATEVKADAAAHGGKGGKKDAGHDAAAESDGGHGSALSLFSGASSIKLEPIVTNIGASSEEWIRLEVAVVFGPEGALGTEEEKHNISEAIVGMLRSKSKDDLSGPSGYLQFREDLADTVMLSTRGRARSAKILSLVVE